MRRSSISHDCPGAASQAPPQQCRRASATGVEAGVETATDGIQFQVSSPTWLRRVSTVASRFRPVISRSWNHFMIMIVESFHDYFVIVDYISPIYYGYRTAKRRHRRNFTRSRRTVAHPSPSSLQEPARGRSTQPACTGASRPSRRRAPAGAADVEAVPAGPRVDDVRAAGGLPELRVAGASGRRRTEGRSDAQTAANMVLLVIVIIREFGPLASRAEERKRDGWAASRPCRVRASSSRGFCQYCCW